MILKRASVKVVNIFFQKGTNKIELNFFDATTEFLLNYEIPTIKRYVRPIYIKPHDDSGHFQVGVNNFFARTKF